MEPGDVSGDFDLPWGKGKARVSRRAPHLVLAWSLDEPERIGEAIPVVRRVSVGRGGSLPLEEDGIEPQRQVGAAIDHEVEAGAKDGRVERHGALPIATAVPLSMLVISDR